MKVKIFEGRIYSVIKQSEDDNLTVYTEEVDGFYKNDGEFKAAMKARGEKYVAIIDKRPLYTTYEITAEVVKEHGNLILDEDYI